MSIDYLGYFADNALVEKTGKLAWDNGQEVGEFFNFLEENDHLRVWGTSTEAHSFQAVTEWIKSKCRLPEFGSQLGKELVCKCDYVHFVLGPGRTKSGACENGRSLA